MSKLVIVESPTKVKKLKEFLGKGYDVDSCVGHIRDLPSNKSQIPDSIKDKPWADYGIDFENGFKPYYVTIRGKSKVITQLKKKLKDCDELLLATDEDREGESISWHLIEALSPKVPIKRLVFNEITKEAILEAVEHPRELDMDLVQAQETRRILDRLYGYALSPLLWKKIGGNLSAGRVQSVAVRILVERERERRAFRSGTYWDLKATLAKGRDFEATLHSLKGKRIATSKDFDKDTGKIAADKDVHLVSEEEAKTLEKRLPDATWTVTSVEEKARRSSPQPPFITATMQQEANNRLNLSAREAMRVAQSLYENGFITYMRTDSTALSSEGVKGAQKAVRETYGEDHLHPSGPRTYEGKKSKGAQEAHEAIRPAGAAFAHPDRSGLKGAELALYRLIWRRTVASQMADERYTSTSVTIEVDDAVFTATGKRVDFAGWRKAYPTGDEGASELPALSNGDTVDCKDITAEGHETQSPARFTEASLVKKLQEEGIGRPSTYASIIDTILSRAYCVHRGKALVPTLTAFAVTGLLETHFPRLVDPTFTAKMEETLDEIASGDAKWEPYLRHFFLGPDGLQAHIAERMEVIEPEKARTIDLGDIPYTVKIGRFGPYVEAERDGEKVTASIPENITPDELTEDLVERLVEQKAAGPTVIGKHPESGEPVYVLDGRFGPYYQLGEAEGKKKPPRASLPRGKGVDDGDLEEALFLLSLPKTLGEHPEDGGRVFAGLGRFGPFVAHEKPGASKAEFRSLKKDDDLKTITITRALELLSEPKGTRGRGGTVIKELGKHPEDGDTIQILEGRYGPYVKHGKTNATIPKDTKPDDVTVEQAVTLLAEKKAKGGKGKGKAKPRKTAVKKKATKKKSG
ncbi:MAG: type I DNA topoisomerase [Euryarchaeota archaeon]|nr:type I DNA topoisomerase [Euryarchaeota archaeon]